MTAQQTLVTAPALPGPGLGIAIDPLALERIAARKEVLLGG